jgi:UDP-galactopyranose mutase
MKRVGIVGAGFSGAVIARELAEAGYKCLVVDERRHSAGNCHTERDHETGVMVHRYGPHIFHTANDEVWDYVRRFGEMMPYVNRVKTTVGGKVYLMPINLHTINQYFGKALTPKEAVDFIASKARTDIGDPQTFEEQALRFVGDEIYKAFFYGYTKKQWGLEPRELPASILKRLPLRFNYDDNYFSHPHQAMPRHGYTAIVDNILRHENIEVRLDCRFEDLGEDFVHTFYSGPLDRYFRWSAGRLGYRTLDFEKVVVEGSLLGTAVMNFGDEDVPYTRISEHKYFAPWEEGQFETSISFYEYSRYCGPDDVPYYPIRLVREKQMLSAYVDRALQTSGVTFVGRLGTYAYLDMDVTIAQALQASREAISMLKEGAALPAFFQSPV